MRKTRIISLALIVVAFTVAVMLYPTFPENVASHWDATGNVNGYSSKITGLFMIPVMAAALFIMFMFLPNIDPLKKNLEKFRDHYEGFILVIIGFLLYIHALTIAWNLGYDFSFNVAFIPAMAALFFYLGVVIENAKRNWFLGIRTPWTLSSDKVWKKTHSLGGKLYKSAAVIALLGLFFGSNSIWFIIVPIICVSLYLVVYSYLEFQKK